MSRKMVMNTNKNLGNFILPIFAVIVVVAAIAIFVGTNITNSEKESDLTLDNSQTTIAQTDDQNGDTVQENDSKTVDSEIKDDHLKIDVSELSETVSFVPYNSNGTDMEVLIVKTSDDVIRCALNTCQVCNGSPYAYFEQYGNAVVCQNCMNEFQLTEIGEARGGCNPIPVTFQEQDGYVLIATADLDENASKFINWKQGI